MCDDGVMDFELEDGNETSPTEAIVILRPQDEGALALAGFTEGGWHVDGKKSLCPI